MDIHNPWIQPVALIVNTPLSFEGVLEILVKLVEAFEADPKERVLPTLQEELLILSDVKLNGDSWDMWRIQEKRQGVASISRKAQLCAVKCFAPSLKGRVTVFYSQ